MQTLTNVMIRRQIHDMCKINSKPHVTKQIRV